METKVMNYKKRKKVAKKSSEEVGGSRTLGANAFLKRESRGTNKQTKHRQGVVSRKTSTWWSRWTG